jgi:hypothetical protein
LINYSSSKLLVFYKNYKEKLFKNDKDFEQNSKENTLLKNILS